MSLLFESIKVQDWKFLNLNYHNWRLNDSRKRLFSAFDNIDLYTELELPKNIDHHIYKCKVVYSREIQHIDFELYKKKDIRNLKLLESSMDYPYKYLNRSAFDELLLQKGHCDEILIVKDGFIRDTSFSNVCFWDGNDWFTPSTPMLKGTKRAYYLSKGIISERVIKVDDLGLFKKLCLINAMLDLEETEIEIGNVLF